MCQVSRPRFSACFIRAYATTNRTSTSGNAAAAVRETLRRATDEAPPTKYPPHTEARKTVVSEGYKYSRFSCSAPVVWSVSFDRFTRRERVPVTIVVITPSLLTCFAHVYWIPIERAAKKTRYILNEE